MRKTIGWIAAILLGLLLVAVIILPWIYGGTNIGMRPYGGMMGRDFGYMHPMGWIGMVLGWLFILAVLVLLGLGIASLIKYLSQPGPGRNAPALPPVMRNCSNCGRPSQPEWNTCPFCGNNLNESQ